MVIFYHFDPGSENNKKDFVSQVTKVATCDIESWMLEEENWC